MDFRHRAAPEGAVTSIANVNFEASSAVPSAPPVDDLTQFDLEPTSGVETASPQLTVPQLCEAVHTSGSKMQDAFAEAEEYLDTLGEIVHVLECVSSEERLDAYEEREPQKDQIDRDSQWLATDYIERATSKYKAYRLITKALARESFAAAKACRVEQTKAAIRTSPIQAIEDAVAASACKYAGVFGFIAGALVALFVTGGIATIFGFGVAVCGVFAAVASIVKEGKSKKRIRQIQSLAKTITVILAAATSIEDDLRSLQNLIGSCKRNLEVLSSLQPNSEVGQTLISSIREQRTKIEELLLSSKDLLATQRDAIKKALGKANPLGVMFDCA